MHIVDTDCCRSISINYYDETITVNKQLTARTPTELSNKRRITFLIKLFAQLHISMKIIIFLLHTTHNHTQINTHTDSIGQTKEVKYILDVAHGSCCCGFERTYPYNKALACNSCPTIYLPSEPIVYLHKICICIKYEAAIKQSEYSRNRNQLTLHGGSFIECNVRARAHISLSTAIKSNTNKTMPNGFNIIIYSCSLTQNRHMYVNVYEFINKNINECPHMSVAVYVLSVFNEKLNR